MMNKILYAQLVGLYSSELTCVFFTILSQLKFYVYFKQFCWNVNKRKLMVCVEEKGDSVNFIRNS